jgi:anthranilate phosphoribosyltransferase
MRASMAEMPEGAAPPVPIGAFLTALRLMREETGQEIRASEIP